MPDELISLFILTGHNIQDLLIYNSCPVSQYKSVKNVVKRFSIYSNVLRLHQTEIRIQNRRERLCQNEGFGC